MSSSTADARIRAKQLQDQLAKSGWSERQLAESLLIDPPKLHAYFAGIEQPSTLMALAISRQLRVRGPSLVQALSSKGTEDEGEWVDQPGQFIALRRKKRGWTPEQLAAHLDGPTKANVWFWENGVHEPSPDNKFKLGQALDFDPHRLWPHNTNPRAARSLQNANFGAWLKATRQQRKLSRTLVGQHIGLALRQMGKLERGERPLAPEQSLLLAEILQVPVDEVIEQLCPGILREANLYWGPRFKLYWLRSGKSHTEIVRELRVSAATLRCWERNRRPLDRRPPKNLALALDHLASLAQEDLALAS